MARDIFGLVGKTVNDKFRFDKVLGEGGYGIVYAGTHLVLSLPVAIKCLKILDATEKEREIIAESFLREARILFGLGHPNVVRLYDVGIVPEHQIPFAVLELLSGTTLAEEIDARARSGRHFDAAELTALFLPMLEGVAFAHSRGIIHRDLKPANVMLVDEGGVRVPKVLDFGTARMQVPGGGASALVDPSARPRGSAFTPLYAAPEQWDRQYGAMGPHTDVFALGLVIAEACLLGYAFGAPSGGVLGLLRSTQARGPISWSSVRTSRRISRVS